MSTSQLSSLTYFFYIINQRLHFLQCRRELFSHFILSLFNICTRCKNQQRRRHSHFQSKPHFLSLFHSILEEPVFFRSSIISFFIAMTIIRSRYQLTKFDYKEKVFAMKTEARLKEKNFFNYEYKLYSIYDESLHITQNVMQLYDVENVLKHCALQNWIMIQLALQEQEDAKSFSIDFSFEDVRLSRESRDRAAKYKKKKTWYYFRYKNVLACDDEKILYEIFRSNIYNLSSIVFSMKCFVQSDVASIKDMLLNSKIDTWLAESIQLITNIKIVKKKISIKVKLEAIILKLFDNNSDDLNLNSTPFVYITSEIELRSWFNDLHKNQEFISKIDEIYKRNMKNVNMKNKKTVTLILIKTFIEMRQKKHFVQVVIILVLMMFQFKLIISFLQWIQSHININLNSTSRLNFKRDLDIEIVEARFIKKLKLITEKFTSDESLKKSKIQQLIEMSIAIMFSSSSSQSTQTRSSSRLTFKEHLIQQLSLKTLLNSVFDEIINQQCNQIFFDQSKSLSQFMFEFKSLINSELELKRSTSSVEHSNSNSDFRLRASTSFVEHSNFDMKDYNDLISLQFNDEHISTILMKILNDKSKNSKDDENIELLKINFLRKFSTSSTSMNHSDDIIVRQFLIVCRATKPLTNQLRKHLNLIQIVIDYVRTQRTQKTSQLMKLLKTNHVETYETIKVSKKNLRNESMLRALIHKSDVVLLSQKNISIDIDEKEEKKYLAHLE